MTKVNSLLSKRLKSSSKPEKSKMTSLAARSTSGNLTSFSGVFAVSDLSTSEKALLKSLLQEHAESSADIVNDLSTLIAITSEVKAINNQAALLHGERIKKVQTLLKPYRDGAFSSWLITAYGNRQTPYNFLQYFELWKSVPECLHPQIERMPRQAVYSLSTRTASSGEKEKFIQNYKGETKDQLMTLIREHFPISDTDQRKQDIGESFIKGLLKLSSFIEGRSMQLSKKQKAKALALTKKIQILLK